MSQFHVEVRVTPRAGLLDPQGKAIAGALHSLGFGGVAATRVGRLIVMDVEAADEAAARSAAEEMCRKLLANPVTEDYAIEVSGTGARDVVESGANR